MHPVDVRNVTLSATVDAGVMATVEMIRDNSVGVHRTMCLYRCVTNPMLNKTVGS